MRPLIPLTKVFTVKNDTNEELYVRVDHDVAKLFDVDGYRQELSIKNLGAKREGMKGIPVGGELQLAYGQFSEIVFVTIRFDSRDFICSDFPLVAGYNIRVKEACESADGKVTKLELYTESDAPIEKAFENIPVEVARGYFSNVSTIGVVNEYGKEVWVYVDYDVYNQDSLWLRHDGQSCDTFKAIHYLAPRNGSALLIAGGFLPFAHPTNASLLRLTIEKPYNAGRVCVNYPVIAGSAVKVTKDCKLEVTMPESK
ncbi:hypothetical protein QR680_003929 [Steinernema hermaphroditum]|uniref:Uncharacterized protein n=1 Tax=Steinernema hermaphroditum TaxID=289476 RepID=A0AA39LSU8_9BILA|nr:hypothetical protein QR680_003929 [Steinernema hermaphroditum]